VIPPFYCFTTKKVIVRRIYLNLAWAMLYNIIAIPVAAGLFLPLTKSAVPPYVAGFAMVLSSVSVRATSLLLRRYRPPSLNDNNEHIVSIVGDAAATTTTMTTAGVGGKKK